MPILGPHTPFLRSLDGLISCRGLDGLKLVAGTGENLHRHNTIWVINASCRCPNARVTVWGWAYGISQGRDARFADLAKQDPGRDCEGNATVYSSKDENHNPYKHVHAEN